MKKAFLIVAMCALALTFFTLSADARDKEEKEPTYSVLMIVGLDKGVTFEVCEDKAVKEKKKALDEEYKAAKKEYEEARKEARKNKEKFEDPKPSQPKLKVLKKGLTEEKANELKAKYEEEYNKKQEKKAK